MASSLSLASTALSIARSEDVKQRRALIPKIAKALSTWIDITAQDDTSTKFQTGVEWIEEKLWLSMTRAPGMHHASPDGVRGALSTCGEKRNETTGDLFLTSLCDGGGGGGGARTDAAAETNVGQHRSNRFGLPHEHQHQHQHQHHPSTHLHASIPSSAASLTHVDQIVARQSVIGQGELIHGLDSTLYDWQLANEHPDGCILGDQEDILICDDVYPPTPSFIQHSAIEALNTNTYAFPSATNTNSTPPTPTTLEGSLINTMTSPHSQSLKDVLGDDMLLWSMWKRRPSTCPPGENDAELLHNMFENDPDMKLFSPKSEDDMSFADIMMLDSYDFSRRSTNSSTSSTPESYSNAAFEQLEQFPPYSYASEVPSASRSRSASIRDTKQQQKQSSALKKTARPPRISEEDLLLQQPSSSRKVDTKTRKSRREY